MIRFLKSRVNQWEKMQWLQQTGAFFAHSLQSSRSVHWGIWDECFPPTYAAHQISIEQSSLPFFHNTSFAQPRQLQQVFIEWAPPHHKADPRPRHELFRCHSYFLICNAVAGLKQTVNMEQEESFYWLSFSRRSDEQICIFSAVLLSLKQMSFQIAGHGGMQVRYLCIQWYFCLCNTISNRYANYTIDISHTLNVYFLWRWLLAFFHRQ